VNDDFVTEVLDRWPGRFRFGRLAVILCGAEQPDEDGLVDAVLRGIAEDEDERSAFDSLLREGRLEAAEYLLRNGPLREQAGLTRRLQALTDRREQLLEELRSRWAALEKRADDADLALPEPALAEPALAELERLCVVSWPEALRSLEAAESLLKTELAAGRERLLSQLAEREARGGADPAWAESSRALVDAGLLRAAARQIDDGTCGTGPERFPALPAWNPELSPEQLLGWHLDPVQRQRQARYAGWAPADDSARELLWAYAGLEDGGFVAAQRFAVALTAFLGVDTTGQAGPDEVSGGYLASVPGAFSEPEITRFRPLGNLDLFIGSPDTREPVGMEKVPPYLAVGPSLVPPAGRGPYAVLALRDVLQLVTLRMGRSTALMRVLGRQWPLATFTGRTPDAIEELLGPDEAARWATLRWVLDLSGLGGIVAADALAFATGWEPALLHLFLQALAERQDRPGGGMGWLSRWRHDRQFSAAVEETVVRPLGRSPLAHVAFWAALAAAPAGEEVSADELLGAVRLAADVVPDADALTTAMAGLARLRLARKASVDCVRLRRCGVLSALGGRAEQRLETALWEWATRPGPAEAEEDGHAVRLWEARRHALSPDYEEYLTALEEGAPASDLDARLAGLAEQTAGRPWEARTVDGTTDLMPLLRETAGLWQQVFPGVQFEIGAPDTAIARVGSRAAQVLLHELLANAGEALGGADTGRVSVHLQPEGEDWLIDVRDSGQGITYPQGREDMVFRPGRSTKGEGRGDGLHRARSIAEAAGGALTLLSRSGGHPILKGAYFRLILSKA
jgi:hypothetical protein